MDEKLDIIKERIIAAYSPLSIYIFGSYAWGNPDANSDIDLLIIVEESGKPVYKRAIEGYTVLFDLNIPKDILVYTKSEFAELSSDKTTLCHKIKNEGIKIYDSMGKVA